MSPDTSDMGLKLTNASWQTLQETGYAYLVRAVIDDGRRSLDLHCYHWQDSLEELIPHGGSIFLL
jgi:hypothetical protein